MADVVYLLITVAFFALTVGFIRICDRIIGSDADAGALDGDAELVEAVAHRAAGGSAR